MERIVKRNQIGFNRGGVDQQKVKIHSTELHARLKHLIDNNRDIKFQIPEILFVNLCCAVIGKTHLMVDVSTMPIPPPDSNPKQPSVSETLAKMMQIMFEMKATVVSCNKSMSIEELLSPFVEGKIGTSNSDSKPQPSLRQSSIQHPLKQSIKQSKTIAMKQSQKNHHSPEINNDEEEDETSRHPSERKRKKEKTSLIAHQQQPPTAILLENLDSAPQQAQQALFELLSHQKLTMHGYTYATPDFFVVIATVGLAERDSALSPLRYDLDTSSKLSLISNINNNNNNTININNNNNIVNNSNINTDINTASISKGILINSAAAVIGSPKSSQSPPPIFGSSQANTLTKNVTMSQMSSPPALTKSLTLSTMTPLKLNRKSSLPPPSSSLSFSPLSAELIDCFGLCFVLSNSLIGNENDESRIVRPTVSSSSSQSTTSSFGKQEIPSEFHSRSKQIINEQSKQSQQTPSPSSLSKKKKSKSSKQSKKNEIQEEEMRKQTNENEKKIERIWSSSDLQSSGWSTSQLSSLRDSVSDIFLSLEIEQYIRNIVVSLRTHPFVYGGPSPRTTILFQHLVQTFSLLNGRSFVTPTQVTSLASSVLMKRIRIQPQILDQLRKQQQNVAQQQQLLALQTSQSQQLQQQPQQQPQQQQQQQQPQQQQQQQSQSNQLNTSMTRTFISELDSDYRSLFRVHHTPNQTSIRNISLELSEEIVHSIIEQEPPPI